MRSWTDDFSGRLFLRKEFLKVKKDPFNVSGNAKDFYVLRI